MKKEEAINDFYKKLASQVNFKKAVDSNIPQYALFSQITEEPATPEDNIKFHNFYKETESLWESTIKYIPKNTPLLKTEEELGVSGVTPENEPKDALNRYEECRFLPLNNPEDDEGLFEYAGAIWHLRLSLLNCDNEQVREVAEKLTPFALFLDDFFG